MFLVKDKWFLGLGQVFLSYRTSVFRVRTSVVSFRTSVLRARTSVFWLGQVFLGQVFLGLQQVFFSLRTVLLV